MGHQLRIATWNIDYPHSTVEKRRIILDQMRVIQADIWILTETHPEMTPDPTYDHCETPPDPRWHKDGGSWVAIWSRWSVQRPVPTRTPLLSLCVEVMPFGVPLSVYGSVIPWANDPGPNGGAKKWSEQYRVIEQQALDWRDLQGTQTICVAGDFNQTLHGPTGYGTKAGREQLQTALKHGGLSCVTAVIDYTIDHICGSTEWKQYVSGLYRWQAYTTKGAAVSDHDGFYIDLRLP